MPEPVAACSRATATARTDRRILIPPTVGPLSFHMTEYSDGYPTKVLIHPQVQQSHAITLMGSRCVDGSPLRFAYGDNVSPETGEETATLVPVGPGVTYTGYMFFTATGRWQVTVTQGGVEFGVLLVEVV